VKEALGETFDAAGGFQALLALAALAGLRSAPMPPKDTPPKEVPPAEGNCALITEVSRSGGCSALVLSEREHGRG
jgi:hypothetical protein